MRSSVVRPRSSVTELHRVSPLEADAANRTPTANGSSPLGTAVRDSTPGDGAPKARGSGRESRWRTRSGRADPSEAKGTQGRERASARARRGQRASEATPTGFETANQLITLFVASELCRLLRWLAVPRIPLSPWVCRCVPWSVAKFRHGEMALATGIGSISGCAPSTPDRMAARNAGPQSDNRSHSNTSVLRLHGKVSGLRLRDLPGA